MREPGAGQVARPAYGDTRYVGSRYGKGENLLVIESAPTCSCPHCGERYLTAETLHEIERIKRQRLGVTCPVAVAEFV